MKINLLPSPKVIIKINEKKNLPTNFVILSSRNLSPIIKSELQTRFGIQKFVDSGSELVLELRNNDENFDYEEMLNGYDAYILQCRKSGIRIDGATQAGVFYGVQTLLQLPKKLSEVIIRDSSKFKNRVIHWDLKGYLPKFEIFLQELRRLALFKINGILLELEDKYQFKCAPEIAVDGAYSFAELRELSIYAKELNIMIIPKLQSLAHSDYILKHEKYFYLAETEHSYEYCATNPAGLALWQAMANELMECFAEHQKYFHIGADEAISLATCPNCAPLGRGGAYYYRVGRALSYIQKCGRMPIMWDDMVRNLHHALPEEDVQAIQSLGKKSVLCYWSYGYDGKENIFPLLEKYAEQNFQVWGASGFSGCDNWAGSLPPLEYRALNLNAWSKSNVTSLIATGWSRIASADCQSEPQESSWIVLLYAASSMWSGGLSVNLDKFIRQAVKVIYDETIELTLVAAVKNLSRHPYSINEFLKHDKLSSKLSFLRVAAVAESLENERKKLGDYLQRYHREIGNRMVGYRFGMLQKNSNDLSNKLPQLRKRVEDVFSDFYQTVTVKEFLQSRFDYLEELLANFQSKLAQTEAIGK